MSKTFKNASRADAQSIDPLELCIIGGQALPEDERGPHDTKWDPTHPLHAHDLLNPLEEADIESVYQHGVIVPIEVVRYGDLPVVSLGRGRVRKARVANIRRKAAKMEPIMVKLTIVRITDGVQLLSRMIDENLRRKTVGVLDQIDLAKQLMARGATEEQVAKKFSISKARFNAWLRLEDNGTEKVRAALKENRLSPSAAMELAMLDEKQQDEALEKLLSAPKATARAAKTLVRGAQGKQEVIKPKPAEHKKLLDLVDRSSRGNEFMQGAKAALRWVTGEGIHKDLHKLLESAENEK